MTGVEVALLGAMERTIAIATAEVGKRLWASKISPKARKRSRAADLIRSLADQDFTGSLAVDVILPALPVGMNLKAVKERLSGRAYQALIHELVSAHLAGAPDARIDIIRDSFRITTRLEFPEHADGGLDQFAAVLFGEVDRQIVRVVNALSQTDAEQLNELRQGASMALLNATLDAAVRHHSSLLEQSGTGEIRKNAEAWELAFCSQMLQSHGYIEPPDFERKRKVPIDALYVPTELLQRGEDKERSTDTWGFEKVIDRAVILGDPGGGKSTAANAIVWQIAKDPNAAMIPFHVTLRIFADNEQSIVEHIERRAGTHYQCPPPPGTVEGILLSGRGLVVFDGLDELIDTSMRRDLTAKIELFCHRYPLTRVLVTSRRVGYDQAALDPEVFSVYELTKFSDKNVVTYVKKWFTVVDDQPTDSVDRLVEAFILESAAVPDLRSNPLMVSLMCIIYRGQHWIPRNRPDMYEHCANLLFDKWDSSRRIYVELQARAHVDSAIKHLAYWMFSEQVATEGVPETALVKEAQSFLKDAFPTSTEARQAAEQFVKFCCGRAWVLSDTGTSADGEKLFSFTHRTFMEYFAAYEITRRSDGPESLAKRLLKRVASDEWNTVAELSVQIMNKHSRNGASRVFEVLLNDRRRRAPDKKDNICSFIVRCLHFVHVPLEQAARIGKQCTETSLIALAMKRRPTPRVSLMLLGAAIPEIGDVLIDSAGKQLRLEVLEGKGGIREAAIEFILEGTNEHFLPSPLLGNTRWSEACARLRNELVESILVDAPPRFWFSLWRTHSITLERLLVAGPHRHGSLLDILFEDHMFDYLGMGWGAFGPFLGIRGLEPESEILKEWSQELAWLGQSIGTNPELPLVTASSTDYPFAPKRCALDTDLLTTDCGWAVLLLVLASVELGYGQPWLSDDQSELGSNDAPDLTDSGAENSAREFVDFLVSVFEKPCWSVPDRISRILTLLTEERVALLMRWLSGEVRLARWIRSDLEPALE